METKKKLTKPQQIIANRIEKGDLIVIINSHHASGGSYVWKSDDSPVSYKAFWGYVRTVKGLGANASEFFSK